MSSRRKQRAAAWSGAAAAEAYERLRPGYPAEAVEWLLPDDAVRVLDLGAGTGKLTRSLLEGEREVVAVDPSAEMLQVLAAAVPGVATQVGTGESIPLPAGSVDAVLCAQAWHWVDAEAGCAEIARVLRPGGTFGLVWNADDVRVGWVEELQALKHGARGASTGQGAGGEVLTGELGISDAFLEPEEAEFEWSVPYALDDLVDLVATRSYILTAPPDERDRLVAEVRDLLTNHPQTAGRAMIDLPMATTCVRTTVRS